MTEILHTDEVRAEFGIAYLALGERYLEEAAQSVRSLKKFNQSLPTSVTTDVQDSVCLSI